MQWTIQWWLGLPLTPEGVVFAYCPDKALNAHHAVTCKFVVARHNTLRNAIIDFCKRALMLNPKMELLLVWVMKGGLQDLQIYSFPAGPLVIIKPAAIDFSITFPLKSSTLSEAGVVTGAAARQTEEKKRKCNDHICSKLGRKCATLVVETLVAWGRT